MLDRLSRSFFFKSFHKTLAERFDAALAERIWDDANAALLELRDQYRDLDSDSRMLILPAAALYGALHEHAPGQALPLLRAHGMKMGEKIARIVHAATSVPGVPRLLWKHMPKLMRTMSSREKGYTRRIISETSELVGVDILSCPLHDAAVKVGVPEAALVVCAMDKAYMTGFKNIRYTRTTSVAEGGECCDYRLAFDKTKP